MSAGPQVDSPGNVALKGAIETGAVFPVVVKWDRNRYEYLGKWRVIDWKYSAWQGLRPHFHFWLQRVDLPEEEPNGVADYRCERPYPAASRQCIGYHPAAGPLGKRQIFHWLNPDSVRSFWFV
ncbi:MAG: hypothetical protein XD69_0786 [Clostridia bacterium 62_21]|nr:MAG: hypothetical protein XD69_0786 [Clostridia bacterium 62_21]HAG07561.1 hypothetical protein [Peptococcaceae bacterium]